jgi:Predicted RNA-binding protein (contains KH domain)
MADIEPQIIRASAGSKKNPDINPETYREEIRVIIENCVKFLVDKPESVSVTIYVGPKTTVYKINCDRDNMGQLIGSQGRTIMGLRSVVHAMTARAGIRSIVEIPV